MGSHRIATLTLSTFLVASVAAAGAGSGAQAAAQSGATSAATPAADRPAAARSAAATSATAKPAAVKSTAARPAAAKPAASRAAAAASHPLDPLTAAEIATAVRLVRAHPDLQGDILFPTVALHEPSKEIVRAFTPGAAFPREAFVEVLARAKRQTFEAIVDLRAKRLVSLTPQPGVQSAILSEEIDRVAPLVRADAAFREAMRKRGLTKMEDIQIDPWAPGLLDPATEPRTTRWIRALAYLKGAQDNGYARPIEGVVALVNLSEMRVERVIDLGVRPVPPETADLNQQAIAKRLGRLRAAPKPLRLQQPLGPSFTVSGHEVRWQKWRFRFAIEPREGLVLYTVGYEDDGRVRSILYRAALSEMLVPYADPASNWSFRNAFDEGEYGLGRLTGSLEVGTDAPRHARLFDAVFADDHGAPMTVPRAVALYERDGGLLWKHFEYFSNSNDARRARELVLFSIVTVGNYDYGFNWIFRQDGTLELQAVLTGIMLPKGVQAVTADATHGAPTAGNGGSAAASAGGATADKAGAAGASVMASSSPASASAGAGAGAGAGTTAASASAGAVAAADDHAEREGHFWHLVAPNVAAVHHQHFFNFRLDFDVDGPANAVREINTRALPPGPDNPSLNAFVMEETALRTEADAQRDLNLASARRWLVVNPSSRNTLGQPAAYLLAPGDNAVPYLHPDSPIRQRAGFINHHFWATPFAPAERHAAGEYPNQSDPAAREGLPAWTQANRPLEGQDVVAWYTFGITHVPRPEEWPVMSATTAGFKLLPAGFFARNPALDVPR